MKICFLIGSVAISGGAYVVFQHASYLSEAGYEVVVAAQDPFDGQTHSWHPLACRLRIIPFELAERETFDLVIATWCRITSYNVCYTKLLRPVIEREWNIPVFPSQNTS